MTFTLTIPDELSGELTAKLGNPGHAALEALAAKAYEQNVFSLEQVRRMLALQSRWQAQEVLSRHGVWPGLCADEILADAATAANAWRGVECADLSALSGRCLVATTNG